MENMTEALKMAFAVLMFVLALSLCISSFSQTRKSIDEIITLRDRETNYTYVESSNNKDRVVSAETIVPTLYKAYKENFEVRFYKKNGELLPLYEYTDPNGKGPIEISIIDLSTETHSSTEQLISDLNMLLAGKEVKRNNNNHERKVSCNGSLYEYFTEHKFTETIGEYYQEDKKALAAGGESQIAETNKTKKRVITYTLVE